MIDCSTRDIHAPQRGVRKSGDIVRSPVMQEAEVYGTGSAMDKLGLVEGSGRQIIAGE